MKVFNTLTRCKEELVPIEPGRIKMYACGPTVYNYIHIGNARPICVFDTLRRYLEYRGYQVTFVQNFTDIDDKLINKANQEGITLPALAERFVAEYRIDAAGLGVRPATIHPRATENIDTILEMVQLLVEKGYAYERDGSVYFRSRKFQEYGKLSHQPLEELEEGARIDVSDVKEDGLDFVLWKAAKPGEPSWTSPWGEGRPGWHIECSAMIRKHLGETIDIHCGGQDLVFPHHENEIAQSECCTGVAYVHYWMHNGYINIDNRKMSKSLGNFFTVREIADQFGYEPIKFMMLQAHYRSPINYSAEVIAQCQAGLDRLHTCRERLRFLQQNGQDAPEQDAAPLKAQLDARVAQFVEAMDDDLNTADGLAALFEMVRDINTFTTGACPKEAVDYAAAKFDELCEVLGLLYACEVDDLEAEVEQLIEQRQAARAAKDFALADQIRDQLADRGIVLKDTPQGVQWSKNK